MEEFQIINNSTENRLQAVLGGHLAMLNYQILGSSFQIDYVYVPPQHRNLGFGALLMEAALDFARERNLQVVPVCSFARAYMALSDRL
jgi:predicted GNAT family acetyltransferase